MKREPSIHITRTTLIKLLRDAYKTAGIFEDSIRLVNYLFERGVNYKLSNRNQLINTNETQKRRVERISKSPMDDANLFNKTLNYTRDKLKHRGYTKYTQSHRDWEFIVELTGLANDFCEAYGLSREAGYRAYISLMFKGRTGGFRIRQAKAFHDTIVQRYNCLMTINNDDNEEDTELAHTKYRELVYEATGITMNYKDTPEKYVFFVKVSELARSMGVSAENYITGNFESLAAFSTGIPAPEQLVTDNGKERVIRWLADNRVKSDKPKVNKSLVEEFKRRQSKLPQNEDNDI